MFAKLIAKFGRRIVMWGVVALASAAARWALDKYAGSEDPAAPAS